MNFIKNVGNWALLIAISAVCVIGLGLWARLAKHLFCMGYGC
jgi:uncharacterized membrane protein YpjA